MIEVTASLILLIGGRATKRIKYDSFRYLLSQTKHSIKSGSFATFLFSKE